MRIIGAVRFATKKALTYLGPMHARKPWQSIGFLNQPRSLTSPVSSRKTAFFQPKRRQVALSELQFISSFRKRSRGCGLRSDDRQNHPFLRERVAVR